MNVRSRRQSLPVEVNGCDDSINNVASFSPSPLLVCASKVYSGLGADIVYGIITLKTYLPFTAAAFRTL
jgi:hypothetical protein